MTDFNHHLEVAYHAVGLIYCITHLVKFWLLT